MPLDQMPNLVRHVLGNHNDRDVIPFRKALEGAFNLLCGRLFRIRIRKDKEKEERVKS